MIGSQERWQEDLFVAGSLRDLIPDDHILRRVDRVLDLSWLRDELRDCYCEDNGRPGIDPEAALRLMLAGLFHGIAHDRKLLREAQVNLAIRWFAGFALDARLPDHSSLTRIRQRWGEERFRQVFQRTVQACVKAGLVNAETVHIDATLIRANVSYASYAHAHAERVLGENAESSPQRKVSQTDPDATFAQASRKQSSEPSYKQHTAIEDRSGVVVDVITTPGDHNEGNQLATQIARVEANTGQPTKTVTADSGYAYGKVYGALELKQIRAVIPPKAAPALGSCIPLQRFKYDERHQLVRCPQGKILHRVSQSKHGWWYKARTADCKACPLRSRCLSPSVSRRTIIISDDYAALLRARRHRDRWDKEWRMLYGRHRWRAEGAHSEAKQMHGLRRAVRRGLWNMAIQVYLTAAVMNLKRLVASFSWPQIISVLRVTVHLLRCSNPKPSIFIHLFADDPVSAC